MSKKFIADAPLLVMDKLSDFYYRLTVEFAELAHEARPGQFLSLEIPGPNAPLLRRPFSIHRVLDDKVQVLFKVVGEGTKILTQQQPGTMLNVMGPLGDGMFAPSEQAEKFLLVAGGIGIAPLLFLADVLQKRKAETLLFFGGRTADDLPTKDDFAMPVTLTTEDGSVGEKGLITVPLAAALQNGDAAKIQVLACGPMPMLKAVAELCYRYGAPGQVSLETMMACGVGSCYGCAIEVGRDEHGQARYERVCHEGPVFDVNHLPWDDKR